MATTNMTEHKKLHIRVNKPPMDITKKEENNE
jgi:hypothetical protein